MKKNLLCTLLIGAFFGAIVFSAMAQINPTDDRYIQVFQPSFTRLTPQGPAVSGTTFSATSLRLNDPKYRSSKGYIDLSNFIEEANRLSFGSDSALQRAQLFHSSLYDINNLKRQLAYLKTNLINYKLRERRFTGFEVCMKQKLPKQFSPQFTDPNGIWEAIKKKALEYYNGAISQPPASEELDAVQKKFYAGEDATELARTDISELPDVEANLDGTGDDSINAVKASLTNWYLDRAIWMELYTNQDKYEDRKGADRPSFEAWSDQKYLYDKKVWEPKYNAIKATCQVTTEPVIAADKKYDYYFYDNVKAAHAAYLSTLPKECLAVLSAELKAPPAQMYRPLPPPEKIVALLLDSKGNLREVYPEIPEPWVAFAESGCVLFNPDGEMAEKFTCDAGTGKISLKEDIKTDNTEKGLISTNELLQFFTLYSEKNDAYSMLAEYVDLVEKLSATLVTYAETYDVKLPKQLDFYTEQGLNEIFEIFKKAQDKELDKVAKDLGDKVKNKTPTVAQLKADPDFAMYYALSYDKKGDMDVTATSAPYVRVFVNTLEQFRVQYGNAEGRGLVTALQGMNSTINASAGIIATANESDGEEDAETSDAEEALQVADAVSGLFAGGSANAKTGEETEYKRLAGMVVLQELTNKGIEGQYQDKLIADLSGPLDMTTCLNGGIIGTFVKEVEGNVKTQMPKIIEQREKERKQQGGAQ